MVTIFGILKPIVTNNVGSDCENETLKAHWLIIMTHKELVKLSSHSPDVLASFFRPRKSIFVLLRF